MSNIAIFASGSGSNAENIVNHFSNDNSIVIKLILANKPDAFVLERAKRLNIRSIVFNREDFYSTNKIIDILVSEKIDFIVLAGFLWLVPDNILERYNYKIVNIHPALLPKYGGKGMYGDVVHKAVVAHHEKESGITIHYVNEKYDRGDIIFQAKCKVEPHDTPEMVASKVHALEYMFFPQIIEEVLKGKANS